MDRPKLLLTPTEPCRFAITELRDLLQQIGLAGEARSSDGGTILATGERFFRHISFLGCSPNIRLEPNAPDDIGFCHLRLRGRPDAPLQLRLGRNSRKPRCPDCRHAIPMPQHHSLQSGFICPGCGSHQPIHQLDWRRNGGSGRFFVELWNIYPAEAVPDPGLLQQLETISGCRWDYFYTL